MPESAAILDIFFEVNKGRRSTGFGIDLLSWSDLFFYCQLHRIFLNPWLIDRIKDLDQLFVSHINKTD